MDNVISDMSHWDVMCNTIIFAINFCNAIKTNCALMFIISNHHGSSNLFHLELWSVMFKVISDIMEHWYAINTIIFVINFCNA